MYKTPECGRGNRLLPLIVIRLSANSGSSRAHPWPHSLPTLGSARPNPSERSTRKIMRRRLTLLAALPVLAACSQEGQKLPFQPEPNEPVTSAMGSGNTTISTPDGISVTVPAGALPAGTHITVARLQQTVDDVPGAVGAAYLVGFEGVPSADPSISFSTTLSQGATAGQLVGMVPLVLRIGTPEAAGAGYRVASGFRRGRVARDGGYDASVEEKFERLKESGIFDGFMGSASTKDVPSAADMTALAAKLQQLAIASPVPAPALFEGASSHGWYSTYIEAVASAGLTSFLDIYHDRSVFGGLPATLDEATMPPELRELIAAYLSSEGSAYLITHVDPKVLAAFLLTDFPANDESSYPLIPSGSTSATFTLLCTGIQWPTADDVPVCSENTIDIRVSAELLKRYPASAFVPNYLMAQATLGAGGSATGQVSYKVHLRSALRSGIAGASKEGSFDLDGSWSARGDTLTIGGHDFLYATPDASTLILSVSDSVQVENNAGDKSWEPVRVNVKLARQ